MNLRQVLTSVLHLLVVFSFFLGGAFFLSLSYFPELKESVWEESFSIGLAILGVAVLLLFGFYAQDRGRYFVIKMGIATDLNVIRYSLEECLARHFPDVTLRDVGMGRKKRLDIQVSLKPLDEAMREEVFIKVEKQLISLLRERFGYSKPFYLVVYHA